MAKKTTKPLTDAQLRAKNIAEIEAQDAKRTNRANAVKDFGTAALTVSSALRRPNQEELEAGREGGAGRRKLFTDAGIRFGGAALASGAAGSLGPGAGRLFGKSPFKSTIKGADRLNAKAYYKKADLIRKNPSRYKDATDLAQQYDIWGTNVETNKVVAGATATIAGIHKAQQRKIKKNQVDAVSGANFELGGNLPNFTETPFTETPIDSINVPQTTFANGGRLEGGTPENPWMGTFGNKGDFGQIQLNSGALAERHEDLKNLKYLDQADTDWVGLAGQIGSSALSAYSGAGGTFGQGASGASGAFDIASTGAGQGIQQMGQNQLGGSGSGDLVSSLSGVLGSGTGGDNALSGLFGNNEDGGYLNQYEDGGKLSSQNARKKYEITQEQYDELIGGLSQEEVEGSYPVYEEGGQLMGYLPEYGFGSWLGDNAGKILKTAGGIVSVIPGFGTVVGPILIGAGYATDAIVGSVRKKRAEEELAVATEREEGAARKRAQAGLLTKQFDPSQNTDYGATFEAAFGGGIEQLQAEAQGQPQGQPQPQGQSPQQEVSFPSDSENPVIVDYGGMPKHEQGGIAVDSKGNPSKVSKQSAVGEVEGGEVSWNGYIFSDKLEYKK